MKKKGLLFLAFGAMIISLASCDFSIKDIFEKPITGDNLVKTTNDGKEEITPIPSGIIEESKPISKPTTTTKKPVDLDWDTVKTEIKNNYTFDYTNTYVYKELLKDSKASVISKVFTEFYTACKNVLESVEDWEVKTQTDSETHETMQYSIVCQVSFEESIDVSVAQYAWSQFTSLNPEFYFLPNYILTGSKVVVLPLDLEYVSKDARKTVETNMVNEINAVKTAYSAVTQNDYFKSKVINDYICKKIDYKYQSPGVPDTNIKSHTIDGFVSGRGGVCECYAKSYQLLSYALGLESICIKGESSANGNKGGHMWNYTKIGTSWYGMDVTWNDQNNPATNNKYFLVGKSTMNSEHTAYNERNDGPYGTNEIPEYAQSEYKLSHGGTLYNPNDSKTYDIYHQVKLPTLSTAKYS